MTTDATASPQAEAVRVLREEAREHKRLSGYHRRRARLLMIQAAGIEVELKPAQTEEVIADGTP